jgi:hypothetical protein
MTKTAIVVVAVVSAVLVPLGARAGYKAGYTVTVGSTYGYGSQAAARSSGDGNQYIGCTTYYNAGNSGSKIVVNCFAVNSAGTFFYCTSSAPEVIQVVATLTPASYIDIGANSNGGQCTYVEVEDYSYYAPTTP